MNNPRRFPLWRLLLALIGSVLLAPILYVISLFQPSASAQTVGGTMDFSQFLDSLVRLLNDASFLPLAVGFVLTFTALGKFIIPERIIRPQTLTVVLQVFIWLVYLVAKERLGVTEQAFTSYLELLTAIGSALLMVVGGGAVTQKAYNWLAARKVPLWGMPQPMRLRKAAA